MTGSKFTPVDPLDLDDILAAARSSSISEPLLNGFMGSGVFVAEIDMSQYDQEHSSLFSTLAGYIRRHRLPIKVFSANGRSYLMRLDIDRHGDPIPNWDKKK